jgi:predicted RNase H-like HicB family nuclease
MKYKVVVEPQEEGGYTVYVPILPGCISQGETVEEALANIKEAIEVYLESLKERGVALSQIKEHEVAVSACCQAFPGSR